jgi:predicted dehydrogenase
MYRIGLVGFGAIAEHAHLPALQSFPEIQVVAVADLSPARLERARELLPHAQLFDSPFDLVQSADITGVDLCTPPSTHAALIEAACSRGLQLVICEKPFVLSDDEYERVRVARAASGATVISVNNWMHSHLNRRVREVLDSGEIGVLQRVELQTARPDAAKGNAGWQPLWRTSREHAGGGIILDHGWHQLYLLMAWMNAWPTSVACVARTADPRHAPVEDEATLDLSFPQMEGPADRHGRIELSWTASDRRNSGSLQGTLGHIEIHDDRIVVHGPRGRQELPFDDRLTVSSYHPDWFQSMIAGTILAPTNGESRRNFEEAGVLVRTVCAAYRSAGAGGRPCSVTSGDGRAPGPSGKRAEPSDVRGGNTSVPA